MATNSETENEAEEFHSGLRYEWLNILKRDELKLLCLNRDIDLDATTKQELTKLLLKSKKRPNSKDLSRLKKQTILTELKAIGINKSSKIAIDELIETLKANTKIKPTSETLSKLTASELQRLCLRREIKIKDYNSKKLLIKLLRDADAADPEYKKSMTTKQLQVELKGRGLGFNGMKKSDMLELLSSEITYEEQKLEQHIDEANVDHLIDTTADALRDFIAYVKENKEQIRKNIKKGITKNKGKSLGKLSGLDWVKISETLEEAKDEMIDMRSMIEAYGGYDLGEDEALPKYKKFECVVDYAKDSDIDEDDEKIVYVVYEQDEDLIMKQEEEVILEVFDKEDEAEAFRQKLIDEDDEREVGIQEVKVNDDHGAEPESDDKES